MRKQFVKTANYQKFRTGITDVENRGAAEASLMLVTGPAGYGKTGTVDQWAVQQGAVYLRAKVSWTPNYFMKDLAEALRLDTSGRSKNLFARVAASIGAQQTPLVVDEVEHCLSNNAKVLEAIRDISDLTEVIVVLVGMERVQVKIARYEQISSRIAKVVEFLPTSVEDVALCCNQLSEINFEHDLVVEIHRQSEGRMREIMNAIATCEQNASRNGAKSISLADMTGQSLTHDWQARRPRLVRASAGGKS